MSEEEKRVELAKALIKVCDVLDEIIDWAVEAYGGR